MRGRFTTCGIAGLALLCAAVGAPGCGGDEELETATFRLLGPPPPTSEGRCPELFEPGPPEIAGADRVRLTYRRAGGGELLCDVVLPVAGGNRVVSVPRLGDAPGPVELYVEVFGDLGAGPILLARGQTLSDSLGPSSLVDITVTPTQRFSCAHAQPHVARAFHTVTPLPNGELLIAGGVAARPGSGDDVIDPGSGEGDFFAIGAIEVVDPASMQVRQISVPGSIPRALHAAVVISEDPIQVALIGGLTVNGDPEAQPVLRPGAAGEPFRIMPGAEATAAPTEIITYDPERVTATRERLDEAIDGSVLSTAWPDGAPMPGTPPVIVGGWSDPARTADTLGFDVLDPATAARSGSGPLGASRVGASVTGLAGAQALVWGGHLTDTAGIETAAGELLVDLGAAPASQAITLGAGSAQPVPRAFHRAVQVAPGRVLVAGGFAVSNGQARAPAPQLAQLVDVGPEVNVTNVVGPGTPPTAVGYLEAIGLGGGDVLLSGGNPPVGHQGCAADPTGLACSLADAYIYRGGSGSLAPTGELVVPRYGHRAARLPDGTVLVTGGLRAGEQLEVVPDAERFDPRTADDDPLADLRPDVVRSAGDVARDAGTLDPVAECVIIETEQ